MTGDGTEQDCVCDVPGCAEDPSPDRVGVPQECWLLLGDRISCCVDRGGGDMWAISRKYSGDIWVLFEWYLVDILVLLGQYLGDS